MLICLLHHRIRLAIGIITSVPFVWLSHCYGGSFLVFGAFCVVHANAIVAQIARRLFLDWRFRIRHYFTLHTSGPVYQVRVQTSLWKGPRLIHLRRTCGGRCLHWWWSRAFDLAWLRNTTSFRQALWIPAMKKYPMPKRVKVCRSKAKNQQMNMIRLLNLTRDGTTSLPGCTAFGRAISRYDLSGHRDFFFLIAGCNGSRGYWQSLATRE